MNTDKAVSPAISFALQKYQAITEPRTESALLLSSPLIPKSFGRYEVGGEGVLGV